MSLRRAGRFVVLCGALLAVSLLSGDTRFAQAQKKAKEAAPTPVFPPTLPGGKAVATDSAAEFIKPPAGFSKDIAVAKTAPTVDLLYFPKQDYLGNPWSNWGDSLAINGKYYASIGDHLAVGGRNDGKNGTGTAHVFEYDPAAKSIRHLVDVAKLLNLPAGHYTPGKIHGRLDMGSDGRIYFSTHRGSTTVTTDKNHYLGDWIIACDPVSGKSEVVAQGPVPKHCIPNSVVDPDRMIFYGGTAPGTGGESDGVQFFAYDLKKRKVTYSGPNGPPRYMILARSTGRVYFVPGTDGAVGKVVRFDPAHPAVPTPTTAVLGLRAATQETADGMVYTISAGRKGAESEIFAFNTKTEEATKLGPAAVASSEYVASIDVDPTGRFLYYVPGAHGGADRDGTPIVQFDLQKKTRKVIAFLHPFYKDRYGVSLVGTYSTAVDPKGDKLYVTWNASRGTKNWDCCALTVIHIPESERR